MKDALDPDDHDGALVRSIVGQQLSTKAARAIYSRLTERFGGRTPTPQEVLADDPDELWRNWPSPGARTGRSPAVTCGARWTRRRYERRYLSSRAVGRAPSRIRT